MPLTCECSSFEDFDWYYEPVADYSVMPPLRRRKRCSSCGENQQKERNQRSQSVTVFWVPLLVELLDAFVTVPVVSTHRNLQKQVFA